jgi:Arabinose-binding domain of AraC transcription regulator, N-term
MSHRGFAHNQVTLLHIAAFLRERCIPPVEIFRRAGVSPALLLDADGWIPRDLCFRLSEEAATVAGERFFGAAIGQRYKLSDLGSWGRAVVAASNLRHACQLAVRGLGLLHQGSELRLLTFSDHAQLRFLYRGQLGVDPQQHLIGTLAVLRKIALLAGEPGAVSVRLSIPHSRGVDTLEETHGATLEFGCEHDAIVIDREIMDQPLIDLNSNHSAEPSDTAAAIGALRQATLAIR